MGITEPTHVVLAAFADQDDCTASLQAFDCITDLSCGV